MKELTARQKQILSFLIETHIETRSPVGSRTLADRKNLELSSASLRHEMGILEGLGYLAHPHTSAGRIPTDRGYQFYVNHMVKEEPVSHEVVRLFAGEIAGKIQSLENVMERASRVLSAMAQEAVVATTPELRRLYLKELNLVPLDSFHVLALWCSTSGLVQNCLVEMKAPISSEEVERVRNFINQEFSGESLEGLEEALLEKIESRRDSLRKIYERTLEIIRRSLPVWAEQQVFVEGSRYIFQQPEFQDLKKLERLMALLEEKSAVIDLLKMPNAPLGVHVAIGEKELSKEIWDCALVSASYFHRGKQLGCFGILGPRRMPYGKIIGLVRQITQEVSRVLDQGPLG